MRFPKIDSVREWVKPTKPVKPDPEPNETVRSLLEGDILTSICYRSPELRCKEFHSYCLSRWLFSRGWRNMDQSMEDVNAYIALHGLIKIEESTRD